MTDIIFTCVLQILATAIVFGLLSRRWIARMISEHRAKRQDAPAAACGHTMILDDEGFAEHVVAMMMVD